jgi:hypothetical protein
MSGSTSVIVASTLPVAVLLSGTTHPVGVEPYKIEIAGNRDPGALHGTGITYDVDGTAFDEWMSVNEGLVDSVRVVTQAEVDAMADAEGLYGFELGLESGGTLVAENISLGDARNAANIAAQRVRDADASIRDAEAQRKRADLQAEAAKAAREEAAAQQQQAMEIYEEKQRQLPQVTSKPAPEPEHQTRPA